MREGDEHARTAAEAVAGRSYGKLVALLASRTRDLAGAEDALSDAFSAALQDWPERGVPERPESWLLTVAQRRYIDMARRRRTSSAAGDHLKFLAEEVKSNAVSEHLIPDKRLLLIFACAHPAIDAGIRSPLILQTVLGFDAATIASAFLVAPATMAQRLVRAKNKIREARIPFRYPEPEELPERLGAVLEAIYAAFTQGWSDPAGTDSQRRNLSDEAIWLARIVVSLLPGEPEALGLLALMLYAEARRDARRDPNGKYVPFAEQDTARWRDDLITEAEDLLTQASRTGQIGRYQLEAAVQSAHVARRMQGRPNWPAVVALYDALWDLTRSPVVVLNRCVAAAEAGNLRYALDVLRELGDLSPMKQYQPYWAALAEIEARSGNLDRAAEAYRVAIGLEADQTVQEYLASRLGALEALKH